ncbi:MAG: hypothetical protein KAI64_06370, partial [Thermoplasmata archaeon]|nr:hypothetical protein [Thermoplasmata archaeon]
SANTTGQVAKFIRRMESGINFASFPLIPIDPSPAEVLQAVAFDKIWHYNASDTDHWKTYMTFKSYKGDLTELKPDIGFLVNVTEYSYLTVVGYPAEPTQIKLKAGWNLISYPSFTRRTVSSVLVSVSYERVEGYYQDPNPASTKLLTDGDFMVPGYSYWVKVDSDYTLDIYYY